MTPKLRIIFCPDSGFNNMLQDSSPDNAMYAVMGVRILYFKDLKYY